MSARELLLVGRGFEPYVEALVEHAFSLRFARTRRAAWDALAEMTPHVVVVHGADVDESLGLVRALSERLQDVPVPILVILGNQVVIPRKDLSGLGAADAVAVRADPEDVVAHVTLLCEIRDLSQMVLNQRSMIERHVDQLLRSQEDVQALQGQLDALLEHGPLVMYSAEASLESGPFGSAVELGQAPWTYVDGTIRTLLGYDPGDLVGLSDAWRGRIYGKDLRRLDVRARRLFARGQHACEYRVRHADGRLRWIHDEARLLRRDDGAAVVVVGCLRDVTRERGVTDVVARNQGMLQRAQRMHGAQRLAGTVAHDFNNMLAVIMCHAQFASKQLPQEHAAQKSLECMLEAAVRAKGGTRLLVQLSTRGPERSGAFNINGLVRDTVRLVEPMMNAGTRIVTRLRPNLPRVLTERLDIEHVLLNLVINARDAMPTGGTLTVRTDVVEQAASPEGKGKGPAVVLEVSDTGMGMDDRVLKRCFEPFFSTKAAGEGTGLGLFSVLQTVRQCGGAVAVETEQGKGTCFRLHLPAVERREHDAAQRVEPASGTRPVEQATHAAQSGAASFVPRTRAQDRRRTRRPARA